MFFEILLFATIINQIFFIAIIAIWPSVELIFLYLRKCLMHAPLTDNGLDTGRVLEVSWLFTCSSNRKANCKYENICRRLKCGGSFRSYKTRD